MSRDSTQFLQLLKGHQMIIFKVVNSYCSAATEREDLVQEIMLQLWKSYPTYNPRFKPSTWVYRIALNVSISHFRRSSTRTKYLRPLEDRFLDVASTNSSQEQEEDVQLLQKFIRQLKPLDRALMILYLDGKSQAEISTILELSASNISTKIHRIKKHLKTKFKAVKNE